MQDFSLDTSTLPETMRATAYESVNFPMAKLQVAAGAPGFRSRRRITTLPAGSMVAIGHHSTSSLRRSLPLASGEGENLMAHLVISGECTFTPIGGQTLRCTPGWIVLDALQRQGSSEILAPGAVLVYATVPMQRLYDSVPTLRDMIRTRVPANLFWQQIILAIHKAHQDIDSGLPLDEARFEAKIIDLFIAACNASAATLGLRGRIGSNDVLRRLSQIKRSIDLHLDDDALSPDQIAAVNNISARYLRTLFATEDISFTDYVSARRLSRVYHLICDPEFIDVSITKLAQSCGFTDASWFANQFRRAYAATPSDVRAKAQIQWRAMGLISDKCAADLAVV